MGTKTDRISAQATEIARLRGENDYLRSHAGALLSALEAEPDAPPSPPPSAPAPAPLPPAAVAPLPAPAEPTFPRTPRGRLLEYAHAYATGRAKLRARGRP